LLRSSLLNHSFEHLPGLPSLHGMGQPDADLIVDDASAHQVGHVLFGQEELPAVEWQNPYDQRMALILKARYAPAMGVGAVLGFAELLLQ